MRDSGAFNFPTGNDAGGPHFRDTVTDPRADHSARETQSRIVGAGDRLDQAIDHAEPDGCAPGKNGADELLLVCADQLDDIERARIAAQNRHRALRDAKGLGESNAAHLADALARDLLAMEKLAAKELERALKTHPLSEWVERTLGVGARQAGRLLAAIGDPAERPNVAKLWQYAGHGDPKRSQCRKGKPVEHSPEAKMRTHLIAEQTIKYEGGVMKNGVARARSPYRDVYDREREKWADRDTSDGHKHNHALRVVGKTVLKDLWLEARRQRSTG